MAVCSRTARRLSCARACRARHRSTKCSVSSPPAPLHKRLRNPFAEITSMRHIWIITKRELAVYFATPVAFVFIAIFVALSGAFTFYVGHFFDRNQASLETFFGYHPWLYLLLVPAVAMRLWAEERKSGTIEQLLTLPITTAEAVLGK